MRRSPLPLRLSLAAVLLLAACDRAPTEAPATAPPPAVLLDRAPDRPVNAHLLASVGDKIFNDENLSLKQNQSCASCHDPAWGFTSPNPAINLTGSVMFGSVRNRFGTRKPPSAAYATQSPVMFTDEEGTVVGGNFWDGRATGRRLGSPSAEQALFPFVNPVEQALPDVACVVYRIAQSRYAELYQAAWGKSIGSIPWPEKTDQLCRQENVTVPLSPDARKQVLTEYDRVGQSIAEYEASPEVNQFSSKYDAYLAGKATLTSLEREGLTLFEGKAGCAGCHPSAGKEALFTDYTFDNIGVPANPLNPALLGNPSFKDLGLGGFLGDAGLHGAQKVPTLRNLDKRGFAFGPKSYMHNGAFKTLEQVVHFYNTRDVLPNCKAVKLPLPSINCWPTPEVSDNVNVDELGNLGLTPGEERAVVAYLKTLTDGYSRH
jgi:cytochrome c peroxidase